VFKRNKRKAGLWVQKRKRKTTSRLCPKNRGEQNTADPCKKERKRTMKTSISKVGISPSEKREGEKKTERAT